MYVCESVYFAKSSFAKKQWKQRKNTNNKEWNENGQNRIKTKTNSTLQFAFILLSHSHKYKARQPSSRSSQSDCYSRRQHYPPNSPIYSTQQRTYICMYICTCRAATYGSVNVCVCVSMRAMSAMVCWRSSFISIVHISQETNFSKSIWLSTSAFQPLPQCRYEFAALPHNIQL